MIMDLTGQRFGRLVVLEMLKKNSRTYCKCQCDCGNIKIIRADAVSSGVTQSCGCLQRERSKEKAEDLTGQIFGLWTVLERRPKPDTTKNNGTYWLCKCQCGKEKVVWGKSLKDGTSQSCGCRLNSKPKLNLIGQRFGKLIVLEYIKQPHEAPIWKCQCDCGNITYSSTFSLRSGHKMSCGCLISKGEYKIENILQEHNIKYKKQYIFDDLYSLNGGKLRFDFAILNNDDSIKCLIEYQGSQHFYSDENQKWAGWNTEEHLQKTQENDKLKEDYCQKNNLNLIKISYINFNNINWSFLKGKCNL